MKKFFELSVTSRKSVKVNTLFSVEAFTDTDEKVGQLDIKLENSQTSDGLFAKYTPTAIAQDRRISSLRISGNDEEKIQKCLEMLSSEVSKALRKRKISDASDVLAILMLSNCVVPETNTIKIPPLGFEKITSESICNIINGISSVDDWFGIEFKVAPEIADKIAAAAEKERKKTTDEIEQLLNELEQLKSTKGEPKDEAELDPSARFNLEDLLDLF